MTHKKRKEYDDDDGRVVANMNVEGMPWYVDEARKKQSGRQPELSKNENRAFMSGVLKAALLVAAVFVVGFTLFILFCTNIWLK